MPGPQRNTLQVAQVWKAFTETTGTVFSSSGPILFNISVLIFVSAAILITSFFSVYIFTLISSFRFSFTVIFTRISVITIAI